MRKKTLLGILLVVLVAAFVGGVVVWRQVVGNAVCGDRYELFVSQRADYGAVVDSLKPRLRHWGAFEVYAKRINLAETFKPGHYVIEKGMSVVNIARMLKLGMQTPVMVKINNVRTAEQLAQKLARQLDVDSSVLMKAFSSKKLAKESGFSSPEAFFSMFLPNTYEFYWTVSPEEFVARMKQEYDRFWTSEREALRKRSGLSRLEVMTLASIVAEETNKTDEMARIAGVYINRLRKGIPLQADPTVKYAMKDFTLRRILFVHLKYPSPYNTYLNKGLPPSPICMPGMNAINAVLNFEDNNYIYFCARATLDGYHNFARTLAEHNANARAYSAELNRRKIK